MEESAPSKPPDKHAHWTRVQSDHDIRDGKASIHKTGPDLGFNHAYRKTLVGQSNYAGELAWDPTTFAADHPQALVDPPKIEEDELA